jgi:D-alanine transaminase
MASGNFAVKTITAMKETVYLNGHFLPRDEATISPDDRGYIFADGVYEVVKYYNGNPFRYEDHYFRLKRSLNEVQIHFEDLPGLEAVFLHLLEENRLTDVHVGVYVQVTRGINKRVHHFPSDIKPGVYAFSFEMPSYTDNLQNGISVITREDIRWLRCDIKSISLLPNTMLYNQAVEAGAGECILVRNGLVTEATHSSVLAVINGKVITHPLSRLILPGITRKVILEICNEHDIEVEERAILEKELYEVDELIIAGTGSEITPVIKVNDSPVGNKKPGDVTRFLQHKFFELV